jgi:PKHD-type hydroxylase
MKNFNLLKKNENLTNYYYFTNVFTNEELDKIIEISKKYSEQDANVSGSIDHNYRKSKIKWIHYNDETKFIYEKIIDIMKDANNKMWNFNITNIVDFIQYAEYNDASNGEEPGHYDWHMDIGSNSSTRKLSVSIQLTNDNEYDGGDLEFMIHRTIIKAPRERGSCIFFPSYITHRVNNIKKGTRRSLVLWFHGPPFS